jgi:putative ABC transport system ATP-binding protein
VNADPPPAVPGTDGPLIEARDVFFSFGQTPALRGASMAVNTGEIVAVMGPSGSGKSTLLHCLAGILVPDGGEIHLAGRRIDTVTLRATGLSRRRGRYWAASG